MTERPPTIGPTIDEVLEDKTFARPDPCVQVLKAVWEQAKAEELALYERCRKEQYAWRLEYHMICHTPDPEAACDDVRQMGLEAEIAERLRSAWVRVSKRVQQVLGDHD